MDVVFAAAYYDSLTGAQQSMLPLITYNQKISPHVLCPAEGAFTNEVRERGIDCTVLGYPDTLDRSGDQLAKRTLNNIANVSVALAIYQRKVYQFFKQQKPDLLYCNNIKSVIMFGPTAKALGIPIVLYARIDDEEGFLDDIGLFLSSAVIVISDGVRDRFRSTKFGAPIKTIYTGVDTEKFSPQQTKNDVPDKIRHLSNESSFVLTQVASIMERKGQLDLLKSAKKIIKDRNITIRFVGEFYEEKYEAKVRRFIQKNNLTDSVEFHGWQDDVRPYYLTTDVFVLPSYNEGFPRSILEALSMKTAVIATPAGGTEEIIQDGKTGLIAPMGNPAALAERILRVANNRSLQNEIATNGQKKVLEEFGIDSYVYNFEYFITNYFS